MLTDTEDYFLLLLLFLHTTPKNKQSEIVLSLLSKSWFMPVILSLKYHILHKARHQLPPSRNALWQKLQRTGKCKISLIC